MRSAGGTRRGRAHAGQAEGKGDAAGRGRAFAWEGKGKGTPLGGAALTLGAYASCSCGEGWGSPETGNVLALVYTCR